MPTDVPGPSEADLEVNLSHAYYCSHLLPDPGGEVCRGFIRRLAAAESRVADLAAELAAAKGRAGELEGALREWHRSRESLSGDCARLGITSSDTAKWGLELARRCEPLRAFCSALLRPGAGGEGT